MPETVSWFCNLLISRKWTIDVTSSSQAETWELCLILPISSKSNGSLVGHQRLSLLPPLHPHQLRSGPSCLVWTTDINLALHRVQDFCLFCPQHLGHYLTYLGVQQILAEWNFIASYTAWLSYLSLSAPLPPWFLSQYELIHLLKTLPIQDRGPAPSWVRQMGPFTMWLSLNHQYHLSPCHSYPESITELTVPCTLASMPLYLCSVRCLKWMAPFCPDKQPLDSSMSSSNRCPVLSSAYPIARSTSLALFCKVITPCQPIFLSNVGPGLYFILPRYWHTTGPQ